MNKYVVSTLDNVLRPVGENDGSMVMCEDHMKGFLDTVGAEDDRIFDVRLFPDGESFECEHCAHVAKEESDRGRKERAPTLLRLFLLDELNRLMGIAHRLATVVVWLAFVVAGILIETGQWASYLGRYWEARVGEVLVMVVVGYVVLTRGMRWLITGSLVKWSRHSVAAGSHSPPRPQAR